MLSRKYVILYSKECYTLKLVNISLYICVLLTEVSPTGIIIYFTKKKLSIIYRFICFQENMLFYILKNIIH